VAALANVNQIFFGEGFLFFLQLTTSGLLFQLLLFQPVLFLLFLL